ncbi:MAG TPA: MFS transporter [Alphaproteobacteria bacterium]|nr:MFS transporter [Alphaproteobacteria bacterium]
MRMSQHAGDTRQTIVIGIIGFLTLVDLFAAQAILPTLVNTYHVTPGAMGLAVNASTLGMAIAGLVVSLISGGINRRRGIYLCLAVLAIPTTLLAFAPSLTVFAILRIVQGVFMATAFTLTMAYLAEECTASGAAAALAAYVTGGVASNLVGRLVAGFVANHFGLAINFYTFAVLNLVGAALVYFSLKSTMPMHGEHGMRRSPFAAWAAHIKDRSLRACFGMGFLILFAFIGTFTYVNFVLSRAPLSLSPMSLGLVYFVFLPSMFTTPLAGRIASRFGSRLSFWVSLCVAAVGLPLILLPNLAGVLTGLVLVGVGTFFAQATATGFVGRAAHTDRVAASGLYLASYYFGGLAGAALLGQVFDHFGWGACVAGIGISLALAALLAIRLEMRAMTPAAAEMLAPMKANSKFTERKLGRS